MHVDIMPKDNRSRCTGHSIIDVQRYQLQGLHLVSNIVIVIRFIVLLGPSIGDSVEVDFVHSLPKPILILIISTEWLFLCRYLHCFGVTMVASPLAPPPRKGASLTHDSTFLSLEGQNDRTWSDASRTRCRSECNQRCRTPALVSLRRRRLQGNNP